MDLYSAVGITGDVNRCYAQTMNLRNPWIVLRKVANVCNKLWIVSLRKVRMDLAQ